MEMYLLGIDPGPVMTAFAVIDSDSEPGDLVTYGIVENEEFIDMLREFDKDTKAAMEMVASYGMAVGKTVFETCRWIGRFDEVIKNRLGSYPVTIYRKSPNKKLDIPSVAMELCKSTRAKDANVRQALLDMYPAEGGGKCPQVGTKKQPGPLFGVSKDVWAALGVAHTFKAWLKRKGMLNE